MRQALSDAIARLSAVSATPRLDAELLMAHALGRSREALLLGGLDDPAPADFGGLVERRLSSEPVAYITGARDFWTISLAVGPGVLIPRPDSETLIEAAVAHFRGAAGPKRVLDLGTGSGALLLAALAEWPKAGGVGVDRSPEALAIARANAERLGMADRADMIEGDWSGTGERFDLILCNPPYIAEDEPLPREVATYEPASALFAGGDGLDAYRAIAPLLRGQIAPGGIACLEIGATQAEAVAQLLQAEGFAPLLHRDLAGRERCVTVTP
ncbi:MAG TPA: peptide chain release factor N(5)-glutamine methyltransferase [Sphingomonas sp.]|nr:peptide chain release factor N(5)-glutamine methyltransferase [Sphingomonas sp.]